MGRVNCLDRIVHGSRRARDGEEEEGKELLAQSDIFKSDAIDGEDRDLVHDRIKARRFGNQRKR